MRVHFRNNLSIFFILIGLCYELYRAQSFVSTKCSLYCFYNAASPTFIVSLSSDQLWLICFRISQKFQINPIVCLDTNVEALVCTINMA
jgi:hypothetical protein